MRNYNEITITKWQSMFLINRKILCIGVDTNITNFIVIFILIVLSVNGPNMDSSQKKEYLLFIYSPSGHLDQRFPTFFSYCLFKINEKNRSIVDFFICFLLYRNRIEPWPPNRGTYRTVTSVYRATPIYKYICINIILNNKIKLFVS